MELSAAKSLSYITEKMVSKGERRVRGVVCSIYFVGIIFSTEMTFVKKKKKERESERARESCNEAFGQCMA